MTRPMVTIQSVLYHSDTERVERALESLDNAARWARFDDRVAGVRVRYGDCSPASTVDPALLERWRRATPNLASLDYVFFGENLGHGGAQNRLAAEDDSELRVMANPDVIITGDTLGQLVERLEDTTIGAVEAKQLPLEHPKDYDVRSGITSWVAGAFCMVRSALFDELGGYDHESFFMYCDDVDLSWRIRERGFGVAIVPAALAFHDKRIGSSSGVLEPTSAERYYSVESALLLADKWSRPDISEDILRFFDANPEPEATRACAEYRRRRDDGLLADRHDPDHTTAEFTGGNYAEHRYGL